MRSSAFEQIPPILLDATTAVEDKTFWENAGFDPVAIIAAAVDSFRGNSRGASTITQQLVRNRLLDPELVQDPDRTIERKLKEIIQSIRVTQAFPGEEGKQEIIAAYLNQNYYGNQSYGVKAAVDSYFGIPLADLTPAQAAIIAGLPKSPSNYDLVRNAVDRCTAEVPEGGECPTAATESFVPADTTVVERRNLILGLLAEGRTPMSGDTYTAAQFRAATKDEVLLAPQTTPRWIAPHFVWAVLDELAVKLCAGEATCDTLAQGGLRVTTTLDTKLQKVAEKWVKAATIVPHTKDPAATAKRLGLPYEPWMANLRDKNLRNGALVAQDYQTGEIVAYVGSADYYARTSRPEFQPQYDVAGKGFRQPGSAFKPFNYAVGIDDGTITAGTMIMDSATDFGGGFSPANADRLERGPVRARSALQFSLNIPSVKVGAVNGTDHVFAKAKEFGMTFQTDTTDDGLTLALGVAGGPAGGSGVRLRDPGERRQGHRPHHDPDHPGHRGQRTSSIRTSRRPASRSSARRPPGSSPTSSTATRSAASTRSGASSPSPVRTAAGRRRSRPARTTTPRTSTPTATSPRRRPPAGPTAPTPSSSVPGTATATTPACRRRAIRSSRSTSRPTSGRASSTRPPPTWPETNFKRPAEGLTKVAIDPFTGMLADPGKESVEEWFIVGTEPRDRLAPDTCGVAVLEVTGIERGHDTWLEADRDWIRRAERGPGVVGGPDRTRTSYFYNNGFKPYGSSWGALVVKTLRLRRTRPIADLLRPADAGSERGDPVVRGPVAVGFRGGRGTPLPHAVTIAAVRVPIGVAVARAAHTDPGCDADPDPGTDPDALADPDARTDTDPDAHAVALTSAAPAGRGSASIPA